MPLVDPASWTQEFRRNGYVHFERIIPEPLLEKARRAIAMEVEQRYDAARLVEYNHQSWCPELRGTSAIKNLFHNKAVEAVLDQALGRKRYGVDQGQIAIRKAQSAEFSSPPVAHLDGIPTADNGMDGTEIQNFTALAGIFLTEVKRDYAGNFTVWPGSHLILEKYFREGGKQVLNAGMPKVPIGDPVQLHCQPGDVVLCHYELAHAAAVNTSPGDRVAIFFRIWLNDIHGPARQAERWQHLTHIWTGWNI